MAIVVPRVTSRGQVTISKTIRDALGLEPGDEVSFEETAHAYEIRKEEPAMVAGDDPFGKYRGAADSDQTMPEPMRRVGSFLGTPRTTDGAEPPGSWDTATLTDTVCPRGGNGRSKSTVESPGGGWPMSAGSSSNRETWSTKITLTQDTDGWWTARDEVRGLTTQGETRAEALSNLDEVIDSVENDSGRPPTDEELRAAGISPEANRESGSGNFPDVLK